MMSSKVLGRENLLDWEVVPAMKPNCASPLIIAFGGEDVIAIWIENMIKLQVPAKSFVLFFIFYFSGFSVIFIRYCLASSTEYNASKRVISFFLVGQKSVISYSLCL